MSILVHYSDETLGIYKNVQEAEDEILQQFSDSDMTCTPEYVEEVDEQENQVAVFSCTWSLELEKQES